MSDLKKIAKEIIAHDQQLIGDAKYLIEENSLDGGEAFSFYATDQRGDERHVIVQLFPQMATYHYESVDTFLASASPSAVTVITKACFLCGCGDGSDLEVVNNPPEPPTEGDDDVTPIGDDDTENHVPTARAGADGSVTDDIGSTTLDGTASSDPDGNSLTYTWSETDDPANGCGIDNTSSPTPTVTIANQLSSYDCSYQLIVNNGVTNSTPDTITIRVAGDNDPPTVTLGEDLNVDESDGVVALTASVTDPDSEVLNFSWSEELDPANGFSFVIDPPAGPVTHIALADRDESYSGEYKVVVSDETNSVGDRVVINVTADDDTPDPCEGFEPAEVDCGTGACSAIGTTTCADGVIADNCAEVVGTPAANDTTCDGIDDDCDGGTDEDYESRETECGENLCASTGETSCVHGVEQNSCAPNGTNCNPPVADAGPDLTVDESEGAVTLNGAAFSDPDGDSVTVLWKETSDPANACNMEDTTSATPTITLADKDADYDCSYEAKGSDGTNTATDAFTVHVTANDDHVNTPPVANAGPDQTVSDTVGTVVLDGTASNDAEGTLLTYQWTKISDPANACQISNPNSSQPTVRVANQKANTACEIGLTVNDGTQDSTTQDRVTIFVNGVDEPPVANAGPDQSVEETVGTVTLNGSASFDPEGHPVTHRWSEESDPNNACEISDATSATPTVTINDVAEDSSCSYGLVANDGAQNSTPSIVTIDVKADSTPHEDEEVVIDDFGHPSHPLTGVVFGIDPAGDECFAADAFNTAACLTIGHADPSVTLNAQMIMDPTMDPLPVRFAIERDKTIPGAFRTEETLNTVEFIEAGIYSATEDSVLRTLVKYTDDKTTPAVEYNNPQTLGTVQGEVGRTYYYDAATNTHHYPLQYTFYITAEDAMVDSSGESLTCYWGYNETEGIPAESPTTAACEVE